MRNTQLSTAFQSREEPGSGVAERKCLHVMSKNGFILGLFNQFLTVGGSVLLGTSSPSACPRLPGASAAASFPLAPWI